jgi:hypothetical protein
MRAAEPRRVYQSRAGPDAGSALRSPRPRAEITSACPATWEGIAMSLQGPNVVNPARKKRVAIDDREAVDDECDRLGRKPSAPGMSTRSCHTSIQTCGCLILRPAPIRRCRGIPERPAGGGSRRSRHGGRDDRPRPRTWRSADRLLRSVAKGHAQYSCERP